MEQTEEAPSAEVIKTFEGEARIREGQAFGFVEDYFVAPDLVKKFKLEDGALVSGKALVSFNAKKGEWGWKVVGIKMPDSQK